ncbi:transcriptional regulator SplA domain-containing protein [Texcoconibacillus texcoconensis]|uniref:Transcriptional regulator of the spore photoproduct lyase operon n=1 Tax=Texcoconibacillus texcoconensis TaxID=1095777 RepID=A0A840QPN1_9BACI|nr:transcriptional regulator SplA domain-containing protein [Texcoconibacillus texcoconensis]MBB5173291.1 transcriptional regulator of the spore photoproduct lyase operon [Texcoconibacillus texcoconensis]
MNDEKWQAGDSVYVIQRNPHTQSVAQIQEATIVESPHQPGELSLFSREEYYPISKDLAVFSNYDKAAEVYEDVFGFPHE